MGVYSLGRFDFVTLHGLGDRSEPPPIPRKELIPIQRPGVDGTGFVEVGVHAGPIQLRSAVDLASPTQVTRLFLQYRQLITAGSQKIVWADIDYSETYATEFVVLDVQYLAVRQLTAAAGGKNNGTTWVEALWTLFPVPIDVQPPEG